MKFSVITVCKNAEAHIEQALRSVIQQTYPQVEYVIIDGGSGDRTLPILHTYQAHITHLVSEPDDGIYAAMNKGIRLATGDFLYFLNADDYLVDAQVFQDVANFIAQQPDCNFVYGQMEMRLEEHQSAFRRIPQPPEALAQALLSYDAGPQHSASFFGRTLLEQIGGFDETYRISADYEWFLRLAQAPTARVGYIPRLIASCSNQGLSCREPALSLQEFFQVQNNAPLYQQAPWPEQRIAYLQNQLVQLYANRQVYPVFPDSLTAQRLIQKSASLREQLHAMLQEPPAEPGGS